MAQKVVVDESLVRVPRNAVSFSFARTTKRFPSSRWHFVTKKQCNELRGARIYGDLPWRGETISQHGAQINRLSAPGSARSLLPKV